MAAHISAGQTQSKGQARCSHSPPELASLLGPPTPVALLVPAPPSAAHQKRFQGWHLCDVCCAFPVMPQPTWCICWHQHRQ